jgi:hypothetical protein
MYDRHLQEMARGLVEAGLATEGQKVELVLFQYWADKVAVVWTTEDVHSIQDDFDAETGKSSLSDEQALEILLSVFENHDCNNGITWESLRYSSQEFLEELHGEEE